MEGTDEATRTESVPRVVDTGIHTYVVPDLSRKSHAGKTPLLPLFFQQRSCFPSPVLSSLHPPFRIGQRPSIHHFCSRVFVRLLAFSRPFRRPIRGSEEGGGISFTIDPVSMFYGRRRKGLWIDSFFGRERFLIGV